MDLTCLLLTSDAVLLNTVRAAFSAVGVGLEVRADAASAIELAGRRHIDGFLIDCDDVRRGAGALASIRKSRSNKLSIVFAILNGKTSVSSVGGSRSGFACAGSLPYRDAPKPGGGLGAPGERAEGKRSDSSTCPGRCCAIAVGYAGGLGKNCRRSWPAN